MPYVKKEEYEKMQKELKELKIIKNKCGWRCFICEKKYFGMNKLYKFNGRSVCSENKFPYFQKIALLTIKGLRKNYLINNVEKLILKYLYAEYRGDDLVLHENLYDLTSYCRERYYDEYGNY